jgi:multicopper oxidase
MVTLQGVTEHPGEWFPPPSTGGWKMSLRTIRLPNEQEVAGLVGPNWRAHFNKHVCPPTFGGGPIDDVRNFGFPEERIRKIERELLVGIKLQDGQGREFRLRDGSTVPMWIIAGPDFDPHESPGNNVPGKIFPSKRIRVVEGEVVHAKVSAKGNTHTIHWHGIEPTPMNDGVGKHSFEISGSFIYQWSAGTAGTYFYHCHKNTTLHFEMGLFGLLIVDPKAPEDPVKNPHRVVAPYKDGGPGFVRRMDDVIPYDREYVWVIDDIDSQWHKMADHDAFIQKCNENNPIDPGNFTQDGFLNDFQPDIFLMTDSTGRAVPKAASWAPRPSPPERLGCPTRVAGTNKFNPDILFFPEVALFAETGETILLRVLDTSYTLPAITFGTFEDRGKLDVEVIAMDGRPRGHHASQNYFSSPFKIRPGDNFGSGQGEFPHLLRFGGEPALFSAARRWDLIIKSSEPGTYRVLIEFFDWVSRCLYAIAVTSIVFS